jgi:hypothetical protein
MSLSDDYNITMYEEKDTRRPRYALYALIIIVILLLILILFLYLIRSPLIFRSGASSSTVSVPTAQPGSVPSLSLDNSYVFASPLRAKVGGEQIRVTVFILNDRGLGMAGKTVSVGGGDTLQVTSIQPITDSQGRATFDIASNSAPGVYIIQASVDSVNLTQKATITFD